MEQPITSRDPEVMSGVLVFAGTRVPVQALIDAINSGETLEEFLDGYPTVSRFQAEEYLHRTVKLAEEYAGGL